MANRVVMSPAWPHPTAGMQNRMYAGFEMMPIGTFYILALQDYT